MSEGPPHLCLDEDVHLSLAEALRKRGFDAVHVGELRRLGQSDESQLAYATSLDRAIFTFNVGDFVQLHNRWVVAGKEHAGIIVSKQLVVGEALRRLLSFLRSETRQSLRGQVRFL